MVRKPASEESPPRHGYVTTTQPFLQGATPYRTLAGLSHQRSTWESSWASSFDKNRRDNETHISDLVSRDVQHHNASSQLGFAYGPDHHWSDHGARSSFPLPSPHNTVHDTIHEHDSSSLTQSHDSYDPGVSPLSDGIPTGRASAVDKFNHLQPAFASFGRQAVSEALPVNKLAPEPEAPRTKVACTFCRTRKLRCDGANPCRHCERRNLDCTYAAATGKTKASSSGGGMKSSRVIPPIDRLTVKKRKHSDSSETRPTIATSPKRSKNQSHFLATGSTAKDPFTLDVSYSSRRRGIGSDLAMIQNDNAVIPKQPGRSGRDGWWTNVSTILGGSRRFSNELVRHLLIRFVQSNAIFFGLLHAPTLLDMVSTPDKIRQADPALYLSVLAVSACDMHRSFVADERTADMRAASEAGKTLSTKLSELASTFLLASTIEEGGLTPALGQAASILALVQPDGSRAQEDLISLAENVVRTLKLYESVTAREPLLEDKASDSSLYWSRPIASESPESEVKYESVVRLCWTGLSHRLRRLIAFPDEDIHKSNLPDFILQIRPMAFWQPSLLPQDLPPSFFHSQDLMRRSAHLSRLATSLASLEQLKEVDGEGRPITDTLTEVGSILDSLDELESTFLRHRPQTEGDRNNILGRTLQMFCRMHVWVRLNIWRRYRLWSSVQDLNIVQIPPDHLPSTQMPLERASIPLLFHELHPTVDYWVDILNDTTAKAQEDFDAHVIDQVALQTTLNDLDSLIRHTLCALDIIEGAGHATKVFQTVNAALNILKRFMSASQERSELPQFDDTMIAKMKLADDRLSFLRPI